MNKDLRKIQVGDLPIVEVEVERADTECYNCIFAVINGCEMFKCRDRTPTELATHFEIDPNYVIEQVKKYEASRKIPNTDK